LLNILGGIDTPTKGEVLVEGEDLAVASEKALSIPRTALFQGSGFEECREQI
jgi:ABC-type lipoprotein export system ATPase subunit